MLLASLPRGRQGPNPSAARSPTPDLSLPRSLPSSPSSRRQENPRPNPISIDPISPSVGHLPLPPSHVSSYGYGTNLLRSRNL